MSDEANIESWFDPFDLRGVLAIIAVIGCIGTMLAIYTVTQSKKIKSLIASIFVSTPFSRSISHRKTGGP